MFGAGIGSSGSKGDPPSVVERELIDIVRAQLLGKLLLAGLEKIIYILTVFSRDFNSTISFKFNPEFWHFLDFDSRMLNTKKITFLKRDFAAHKS